MVRRFAPRVTRGMLWLKQQAGFRGGDAPFCKAVRVDFLEEVGFEGRPEEWAEF